MSETDITAIWERIARFHRMATTAMDEHLRANFDRTLDDYDVLHQVQAHQGPIRMGDLSASLLIANSSCNRLVNRLVEDGLLHRLRGTEDRREVLVELTPTGVRLWRQMAALHTRDIRDLMGPRLSDDDRVQLDDLLQRLGPANT